MMMTWVGKFHRKSNRWDVVTNFLLAEKRLNELPGQEWVKRGYEKKGMKRTKREEFKQHHQFKLTQNLYHLTIVRSDKK